MPRIARQPIGHRERAVGLRAITRDQGAPEVVWEAEAVSDGQVARVFAAHRADDRLVARAYRRAPVLLGGRVDALA